MTNQSPPSYDEAVKPTAPTIARNGADQSQESVRLSAFRQVCMKHEISNYFAGKLRMLEGFEIVFIVDDSGSMSTPIQDWSNPFGPRVTRWQELKKTVAAVLDIAILMDSDGVDLYFLNRATYRNVTSPAVIEEAFAASPKGYTPITHALRRVLADKKAILPEKKLLVIIGTDGEPTTPDGSCDKHGLKRVLQYERSDRVHVTFMACTDDEATMDYLNGWDDELKHVDVVDDYQSEREEVLKHQGKNFPFTYGNYIVKMLLGSIDPELDQLDECRLGTSKSSCSIC